MSSEVYVQDIVRDAAGQVVVVATPNRRTDCLRVGDMFVVRYEISKQDARDGVLNPSRLNVERVALEITKIQPHRLGGEVQELLGASGAAAGFYLAGDGLERITPGCLLQT
ncbi:hypothetical protein [Cupriavidus campinensis]|uniref:hypothetical protein n=1 Tax=Cupriavidus campinensis TaxID=151783 RepID=UPI0011ED97F0|nr:hypothetical protein [Cupriavidus campinensis]